MPSDPPGSAAVESFGPCIDLVKAGALIAAEIDRLRAIGTTTAGNEGVWT